MCLSRCILCDSVNVQSLNFNNIFIIKCNACEFQYIPNNNKYLGEDFYSNYFTRRNAKKHTKLNELRKVQYKIDAKFLSSYIRHNSNILDVGCSSGGFLFEIHNQYSLEFLTGVDIDKSSIKEANRQYSDIAKFKNTNLLEVDSNEQFDLILFRGTFQYLDQDLHRSIQHIKRLLSKNGKIIIYSLPTTDSFIYYLLKNKWALFHPEMSLMFNEESLRFLCEKYSLIIDDISYPYLEDVYADIDNNYKQVQKIISGESTMSTPFWGGVMRIVISKKGS
jgi:SAM-dependent methyltransferase